MPDQSANRQKLYYFNGLSGICSLTRNSHSVVRFSPNSRMKESFGIILAEMVMVKGFVEQGWQV